MNHVLQLTATMVIVTQSYLVVLFIVGVVVTITTFLLAVKTELELGIIVLVYNFKKIKMKKSILNLGKELNKKELQKLNGGSANNNCYVIAEGPYGILCSDCCKLQGDTCVPDYTQICQQSY